jgi:MarR family transcriptional regulator, lower aerobic nicotinate degradation pathway regulator
VERLESKEWIRREAGSVDKRVKLLSLTAKGAALLRQVMGAVDRAQARMLAPLKPADRSTLMTLMAQLVDLNNEVSRVPLRPEDVMEHIKKTG